VSVLSRRNLIVATLAVGASLTLVHPSWAAEVVRHALPSGDRPTVEQTTTTARAPETTTTASTVAVTTIPRHEEPTSAAPVTVEVTTEPAPETTEPAPETTEARPPATEPRHEPTTAPKPPTTEPKHEPTTTPTTVHHEEDHVAATFELRCERVTTEGAVRVVCRWTGDAPDGFSRFSLGRNTGEGFGRIVYTSDNPARREGTDSAPVEGPASYILFALNADGKAIGHSQIVSI
jgi:hypothetical protein